ncbi:hypothetical protein QQ020_08215 [Fulvivirgaceae bacterium BMA12]|uniref:Tetratricopeptide repeat protein n=1 Tax=Agaribacillus aureus TaxID=3051825 RepID=A0ABT8L2Q3_9BACT|nr:hypothetical protein [Fulvivirgaceae bacterium BMA12]
MKLLLTLIAVLGINASLLAQWKWGENEAKAKEMYAKYTDAMKMGNFSEAVEPLEWLLENTPDLNSSIYINGAKIYKALVDAETDKEKKAIYQEKALTTYDNRIKYFKGEANVLNRKAYVAYKYLRDKEGRQKELFELFQKVYELNGNKVSISNHVAYMDIVKRYKAAGGALTDDQILEIYDQISEIITKQKEKGGKIESLEKNQAVVDKLLSSMVPLDCDFIENKLGASFRKDGENLRMAKKIIKLSLTYKCTEQPIFLEAATLLQIKEPTFSIAKLIAIKADKAGDSQKAEKFYLEAITLTEENVKKAEIFYGLANHYRVRGLKSKSRQNALKATAADPSKKEAYKIIGDLYMTSYEECREGVSKVQDRAIYIAAYRMYQKAGNAAAMKTARGQFPSMEEIFELGLKEGQDITVGCWVNETVQIQRRPADGTH